MRKAKILLVNPWITDFAAFDFWTRPLGLLILGGILRKAGYEVSLLDCMDRSSPLLGAPSPETRGDGTGHFHKCRIGSPPVLRHVPRRYSRYGLPLETARKFLNEQQAPDAVFVTSGMTYWYPGVCEMIRLIKEIMPSVPVALGGLYPTLCAEHAGKHSGADVVVAGAGERVALRIAEELTGIRPGPDGDLPPGFHVPDYSFYPILHSAAILTSRGCPFRCPFCASGLLHPSFEQRPPSDVVSELESLARRGVRNIAFYDDALLACSESHLKPILGAVIGRRLDARFHAPNGMQPSGIDEELALLMKRAGFQTIRLSFESVDPERQKQMGGKVTSEDLVRAACFLERAGYCRKDLAAYVISGLPGQSLEEVVESMHFVFRQGLRASIASFSPIPGTASWKEAVASGFLDEKADPLLCNNSVYSFLAGGWEYETVIRLGTLCAAGNGLIRQGTDPLSDGAYARELSGLLHRTRPDLREEGGKNTGVKRFHPSAS